MGGYDDIKIGDTVLVWGGGSAAGRKWTVRILHESLAGWKAQHFSAGWVMTVHRGNFIRITKKASGG